MIALRPVCYGKCAAQGDFVRIEAGRVLIDAIEAWSLPLLQTLTQHPAARESYVQARPACLIRLDNETPMLSLWLPSHDQVGRCFPLVIAAEVDPKLSELARVALGLQFAGRAVHALAGRIPGTTSEIQALRQSLCMDSDLGAAAEALAATLDTVTIAELWAGFGLAGEPEAGHWRQSPQAGTCGWHFTTAPGAAQLLFALLLLRRVQRQPARALVVQAASDQAPSSLTLLAGEPEARGIAAAMWPGIVELGPGRHFHDPLKPAAAGPERGAPPPTATISALLRYLSETSQPTRNSA